MLDKNVQFSLKQELEKQKLIEENKLLRAKTENIQAIGRIEELYSEAIEAMRKYSGQDDSDDY